MLQRFKGAALGLGITLVPIAALACVQFLLAPYTVAAVGMMDPKIDTWAVSQVRGSLAAGYSVIVLIIAAYWLLTATVGGRQFLQIKSANVALALSGLTFATAMVIASTIPMRLFKGACPVLGLTDEHPIPEGAIAVFDGQSSCEAFLSEALWIVLLGLPLILLTTSAILRIVVSRHRDGAVVPLPPVKDIR